MSFLQNGDKDICSSGGDSSISPQTRRSSAPLSLLLPSLVFLFSHLLLIGGAFGCKWERPVVEDAEEASPTDPPTPTVPVDADQDGYSYEDDCDDSNASIYPEAEEVCDNEDNDCDQLVDEELYGMYYGDLDGDGFGASNKAEQICGDPGDGYSDQSGDCDDSDASIYPDAREECDQRDNDCDQDIDEDLETFPYFADEDGDGFGDPTESLSACAQPEGYVSDSNDCDDSSATTNPEADELICDAKDENCNGLEDDANDADGDGYDTCDEGISGADDNPADCDDSETTVFPGGIELCDGLDNDCDGTRDDGFIRVFYVDSDGDGFGDESELSCFEGPGFIRVRGDCDDTRADVHPGATDEVGDGIDHDCGGGDGPQVHVNLSTSSYASIGSAVDAAESGITLWVGPATGDGIYSESGIETQGKSIAIRSTEGPRATIIDGGGEGSIFLFGSGDNGAILDGFTLQGAAGASSGGGALHIAGSNPVIKRCNIINNISDGNGGAIYLEDASPQLSNCLIAGNRAAYGGAIAVVRSSPVIENCTLVFNQSTELGGGIYLDNSSSQPSISNSILAYNLGYNLYRTSNQVNPTIEFSVLYSPVGPNHNLVSLDDSVLNEDPAFALISNDGDIGNDDFHLAPLSPLHDAGDPELSSDPDGSRPDIGVYGGEDAEWYYYLDQDGDALFDGWEERYGLSLEEDNSEGDPDQDGAKNWEEFQSRCSPLLSDTDSDSDSDSEEIKEGSDCTDPYSGVSGARVMNVPSDFPAIQQAVDAMLWEGSISATGSYDEGLVIQGRDVTITSSDGSTIELNGRGDSVLQAVWSKLDLAGLYLREGQASKGGGLRLLGVTGDFSKLKVESCSASGDGGGALILRSDITIDSGTFRKNEAGGAGGGIYAENSTIYFSNSAIEDNTAELGGGLAAVASSMDFQDSRVEQNVSGESGGGGMALEQVTLSASSSEITENTSTGRGAGLFASASDLILEDSFVTQNSNKGEAAGGAGFALEATNATLTGCTFSGNEAGGNGGGLRAFSSSVIEASNTDFTANSTLVLGGGLYLEESEANFDLVSVSNNSAGVDVGGIYYNGSSFTLTRSVVETNSANTDCGGIGVLDSSGSMENVFISDNWAGTTGGGLWIEDSREVKLSNCLVTDSVSTTPGAGLNVVYSSATLDHCVIIDNTQTLMTPLIVGGLYVLGSGADSLTVTNSILAYNNGYNLYNDTLDSANVELTYSDLYTSSSNNHNLGTLDASNLTSVPKFQSYSDGSSSNLHLSLGSSLVDRGSGNDVDGSQADIGMYGGPLGSSWDVDRDGLPDYFWPGSYSDAPSSTDASAFDSDDRDGTVQ